MLILNRKVGESIIIGNDIEVRVLETSDGKVKFGIEAPKEISVLRHEIYDAVKKQNKESINLTKDGIEMITKYNK